MEPKDWIPLVVTVIGIVVSLGGSYFIAKHFGGPAAAEKSQRLHEAEVSKTRRAKLQSLLREVELARKAGDNNAHLAAQLSSLAPGTPTPLPVKAFSTVLWDMPVSENLSESVTKYLAFANQINNSLDRAAKTTFRPISSSCRNDLPPILENLRACLRRELGLPTVEQQMSGSATPAEEHP